MIYEHTFFNYSKTLTKVIILLRGPCVTFFKGRCVTSFLSLFNENIVLQISKMARKYIRKTNRVELEDKGGLLAAVKAVRLKQVSCRKAAKDYDVNYKTVGRYVERFKELSPEELVNLTVDQFQAGYTVDHKQVLNSDDQKQLVDYVLFSSSIFYGLSPIEIRKLAFEYALQNGKKIPESWIKNKQAGPDWFSIFMRKHPTLSIRSPEATSIARISGFNPTSVNLFYSNLEEALQKYQIESMNIWNMDETALSTVQCPAKVVAAKGVKQVGKVTSAERGVTVTLAMAINAMGELISSLC